MISFLLSFFAFFMLATLASSIGILFIWLVKKGLRNHISARWQYNLGLLFFVLLALPFIPGDVIRFSSLGFGDFGRLLNPLRFESQSAEGTAPGQAGNGITYGLDWLQDFAVAVERSASGHTVLMLVWIVGMVAFAGAVLLSNQNLRLLKESAKPVTDEEMLFLFARCKAEIGIKAKINLGSSILAKTPITAGLLKTQIILPAAHMSPGDARYAILHELTHCKNKDVQINFIMCLFQILYWFNPLVYLVFRQMRLDRELACDAAVLKLLPREHHLDYGNALLNFMDTLSRPSIFVLAASMGDSKPQIIKRVKGIISYKRESGLFKVKSICIFALMGLLVLCQMPIISALAHNDDSTPRFPSHFRADNVQYADLSHFFGGFEGSFVLYDVNSGLYIIHNRDMSARRVSPNSTYKIFSALIALETGVLDADNTLRAWDGTPHPFEAWNREHNLTTAMHNSVSWYFQDFDAQVGIEKLHYYLSRLSYGNRNLTGGIADFWMESTLRISPLEQVELLRNLYHNSTVFYAKHVNTLKNSLRLSERDDIVLSGKTGTGLVNNIWGMNGWFIGYVETGGSSADGNTFIFATYIQGEENAGGSTAAQITLSILEHKGIYTPT